MAAITNYKEQGSDLSDVYVTKEYMMEYYQDLVPALKTPQLWSWGDNTYGQLGNNTTVDKSVPTTVSGGGTTWKQIAPSKRNTFAIKTDGTLWTWGSDIYGALGDNSTVNKSSPVTVSGGGTTWKQIAAGSFALGAAIKTDGTLWTWGYNPTGALGNNSVVNKSSPITVSGGGTTWKQVAAGMEMVAAIKTDGTLWTWGIAYAGQLGDNSTINKSSPITVSGGGTTWSKVACGYYMTAAIKTDGTLWAWGYNGAYGQLGNQSMADQSSPITVAGGGTNWKQVSCGIQHVLAIKTDGTLWSWGYNASKQLLINPALQFTSSPISCYYGGTNWKYVAAAQYSSFAIKTDGTLWSWGRQWLNILGTGVTVNQSSPKTLSGSGTNNWKSVFGGDNTHMVAISEAEGW